MVGTGPPLCLLSDSSQNGHLSVKNISEFLQTALAAELSWTRGSSVSITSHFKGEEIIMRVKNINGDCRKIVNTFSSTPYSLLLIYLSDHLLLNSYITLQFRAQS